ncbi:MAG: T9SS type A sorting domain-containing protein [Bacteroidales bacterium]
MKNKIFLLLALFAFPALSFSQEILTGLYTNPVVKANFKSIKAKPAKSNMMLTLPFFDDFSGSGIFPSDSLWADKNVFINSSYPVSPPTVGVATFDAINDTGALYTDANSYGFTADTLTSNPIRLDSMFGISPGPLHISDSVYFSFYYQPQGIGNAPEPDDSLVLEFYSPKTSSWNHIWSSKGYTLLQFQSMYNNVYFKQVMIPLTDTANYFHKGFQFRFYNYASLANSGQPSWAAGNVDIWNIDYVYLNKLRSKADSIYQDLAFVEPAPSVLKNYYSMPWTQFNVNPAGEMKDTLYLTISNLYNDTIQSCYQYIVKEVGGTWSVDDTTCGIMPPPCGNGGVGNVDPFNVSGYQTYQPHARPAVCFVFPSSTKDSADFTITHINNTTTFPDICKKNDTIIYNQHFYNYYAYDDGVPEAGYGLTPANSMLAYQFHLNQADTLHAVKMFFNQTLNNASQQYFHLTIWDDASNNPGNIIYQKSGYKPFYEDSLNKFHTYRIDDTTLVLNGTFYVGWKQVTADNLNIGFDMNSDKHDKIFYNTGNGWFNSMYQGALMIRPVVGKTLPITTGVEETIANAEKIKVYPNPSNGENIFIVLPPSMDQVKSELTVQLFDLRGSLLHTLPYSKSINVSGLQNGIYLLCVNTKDNSNWYITKLIIVK